MSGRRRLPMAVLGTVTLGVLAAITGCGAGTAEASEHRASGSEISEFIEVLRRQQEAREAAAGRTVEDGGSIAMTIERPADFALGHDLPPADERAHARLSPEEVLLSFAMYAEAGRWDEQWELLSDTSRRAWLDRVRREARRVGLPEVEARIAGSEARALWARGFAAGGGHVALDVRWRTRLDRRTAVVQILRDEDLLAEIPLVREREAWHLDLAAHLEVAPVDAVRAAGPGPDPGPARR